MDFQGQPFRSPDEHVPTAEHVATGPCTSCKYIHHSVDLGQLSFPGGPRFRDWANEVDVTKEAIDYSLLDVTRHFQLGFTLVGTITCFLFGQARRRLVH